MSGFLYQMLGCAAVGAATCQDQSSGSSEYAVLVSLVRGRELYQETHGQDLALVPLLDATERGTVLVQFKYSRSGVNKQVTPSELITIAKRLAVAAESVKGRGDRVARCCLVTNRRLSPDAAKLLKSSAHVAGLSAAVRGVLKKLLPVEEMDTFHWLEDLRAFAVVYGCLATEIEDGMRKIVGRLFQQGADYLSKPPLRLAEIVEAFTGGANAMPLVQSAMGKQTRRELDRLDPEGGGKFVRREILERVVQEAHDRALIVFAGRGGVGKTASLHTWACELFDGVYGPVRPFIAAVTTHDLPAHWPDSLLSEWWNLHPTGPDRSGFDLVVDRLKIANPGLPPPILHVCLDGLDEHADHFSRNGRALKVVRDFLQRDRDCRRTGAMPTARLVVTCRSGRQFVKEWCSGSSGFPPDERTLPPIFNFDQFTDREFDQVVRDNLPPPLHDRLLTQAATTPTHQKLARLFEDGPVDEPAPRAKRASRELIDTLHDPAMWRSFLGLDASYHAAVLDDEREARLQLGVRFVNRFCEKLEKRTTLREADVLPTLRHIAAVHQHQSGKYLNPEDWTQAARGPAILNLSQIDVLLAEARSGGLVNDNAFREWQWRNSIIEDCLLYFHDAP